MATTHRRQWSPLLVASAPPSLVVDRFRYPMSERDLCLAAWVHRGGPDDGDRDDDTVATKLAAVQRGLLHAARTLGGDHGA